MLIRRKNTAPYIKEDTNMYIKNNIIHVCASTGNANSFHKCLCFPMNNLNLSDVYELFRMNRPTSLFEYEKTHI